MTRALMLMVLLTGCDEVDKATDAVAEVLTGGQEGEAEGGEAGLDPDAGAEGYGYAVGDIIPDVALTGPDGSAGLHDYADGGPMVVVLSTMWAAPCSELCICRYFSELNDLPQTSHVCSSRYMRCRRVANN